MGICIIKECSPDNDIIKDLQLTILSYLEKGAQVPNDDCSGTS